MKKSKRILSTLRRKEPVARRLTELKGDMESRQLEARVEAKRSKFSIHKASNPPKRQRGDLSKGQMPSLETGRTRGICFRCPGRGLQWD